MTALAPLILHPLGGIPERTALAESINLMLAPSGFSEDGARKVLLHGRYVELRMLCLA